MEGLNSHTLMICLVILVSSLFLKVYHSIWWRPKRLEKSLQQQGIKGSPYKPLTGDMKEYIALVTQAWSKPISLSHRIVQRVDPFTDTIVRKYGKVSFSWSGTKPSLIIMDPKLIKEVLTNKQGHIQKPSLNTLILILTKGLTTLQGEEWAAHRRIINPAFHLDKLKGMIPVFVKSSVMLIEKWKKSMADRESLEVDVWPDFQELTWDVISRTAFGSNYEEGKEIMKLQKELQKLVIETMLTLYIPGLRFIPTKKNNRRKELDHKITSMLRSLVETKANIMSKSETNEDNLLSLLLQSNNENNPQVSTSKHMLSMDDVIEECKQFYLAGHETTSSLLTWTVIVLAMHPDWQHRAREEVVRLCGDKDPDADVISHLKIVNMILHEVLRLYPPVIALYQHAHKKTEIGNLTIHAGIDLLLPIMLVNRDTGLWGDDADEFKPERFADGVSKACKDQTSFLPFGWGPRICIGQNFAMIEAKIALAMILKHFSFELSGSYAHAPYTVMTLQPQHGAHVVMHPL
ncbi:cytochrome p450 72a15 [Phtheirospermum japonicum]|uniref:Cytochrome p450 72a15 n=1 Tax=Phtheirospermum japonicum TaxID=374723 RepID=A0A830B1Y9_9LAMI|nr:cytochrome p450 72a15 [Phtheirospermum japonicum]